MLFLTPIFGGKWQLLSAAIMWPPKVVQPYFQGFFLAAENSTLFLMFFPSHQKLICSRGSTYPHFNFTPVLKWKITQIHIIIHNNLIHSTLSSIHKSHPLSLIHTHESVIHLHPSLILSLQVSYIDIDQGIFIIH
jgi:hypothetical protein